MKIAFFALHFNLMTAHTYVVFVCVLLCGYNTLCYPRNFVCFTYHCKPQMLHSNIRFSIHSEHNYFARNGCCKPKHGGGKCFTLSTIMCVRTVRCRQVLCSMFIINSIEIDILPAKHILKDINGLKLIRCVYVCQRMCLRVRKFT